MEFKLNIYNGKEIEKTYTANTFILKMGVAEDLIKLINIDNLSGSIDDEENIMEIIKIVIKAFDSFNPIIKEIFDGLTDDEYRRTNVIEVGRVVIDALKYTFAELFSATAGKN